MPSEPEPLPPSSLPPSSLPPSSLPPSPAQRCALLGWMGVSHSGNHGRRHSPSIADWQPKPHGKESTQLKAHPISGRNP